ncbi:MAG: hypothetical protein ACM31P_07750 [Actinomycetota bacterium]
MDIAFKLYIAAWATACLAAALITLVAPYTGDGTWDYTDSIFMSFSCFATAPWVVAVLYSAVRSPSAYGGLRSMPPSSPCRRSGPWRFSSSIEGVSPPM